MRGGGTISASLGAHTRANSLAATKAAPNTTARSFRRSIDVSSDGSGVCGVGGGGVWVL